MVFRTTGGQEKLKKQKNAHAQTNNVFIIKQFFIFWLNAVIFHDAKIYFY